MSGVLANAGGSRLAPLYVRELRLPLKTAFAWSLVTSAILAVAGTAVHAVSLGHVDWTLILVLAWRSFAVATSSPAPRCGGDVRVLEPTSASRCSSSGAAGIAEVKCPTAVRLKAPRKRKGPPGLARGAFRSTW